MGLQLRMFLMFFPTFGMRVITLALKYTRNTFIKGCHTCVEQKVFDILAEEFVKICREYI